MTCDLVVQIISPDAALNGILAAAVSSVKNCLPQTRISWPAQLDNCSRKLLIIGNIDLSSPDKCELLLDRIRKLRLKRKFPKVILIADRDTGDAQSIEIQKRMLEAGVCEIMERPLNLHRIRYWIDSLVGQEQLWFRSNNLETQLESDCKSRLLARIHKVAPAEINVLLAGETGVGKTWWAEYIHKNSRRASKPFVVVNCANFTPALAESQLFGHAKGAFTGADKRNIGRFELAGDGTIFLDEIDSLPLEVQGKLLHVVENREFVTVGGHKSIPMNARIISATNRLLDDLVQSGSFRTDLFYRLNAYEVKVPALRERIDEIEGFSQLFCQEFSTANKQPQKSLDSQVIAFLEAYDWPGNLRELRNCIQHAIIDSNDAVIRLENLPERVLRSFERPQTQEDLRTADDIDWELSNDASMDKDSFDEAAKLIQALEQNHDNRSEAARQLGVSRTTLYNMMKRLCLI